MRGEENGSSAGLQDLSFQDVPKFCGGERVDAARRLIEEENAGPVKQGAREAEALYGAGRKCPDLAVECFREAQLRGDLRHSRKSLFAGEMIELAKEKQVFPTSQSGEEAKIAAGMVAKLAANGTRLAERVVAGYASGTARGKKKSRQDAQEAGFASAIRSEQADRFAFANFKGDSGKGGDGRLFERLKEGAPATARGRKSFLDGVNNDGGLRHGAVIAFPAAGNNCAS
jgi:hypothetical protein